MSVLHVGIARYLSGLGLVKYSEIDASGDCYLEKVPQAPDQVVVVTPYGGSESDARLGYDEPHLQVRVRGTQDPTVSYVRAQGLYNALHGLTATLPDGTQLVECICIAGGPEPIGQDTSNRFEHVLNFRCEVRNQSGSRS